MPEFIEFLTRKIETTTNKIFEKVMQGDLKNAKHFLIMRNEFIEIYKKYNEIRKNTKDDLGKLL